MIEAKRMDVVDALRGFALIGILFVHILQHFIPAPPPEEVEIVAQTNSFEQWLAYSIYWIGMSKFFSLFSMLFGLSFYIQLNSSTKKGQNFHVRYLWKMTLLVGFGLFHWLFFQGDILMVYGFLGMLFLFFWKLDSKVLFVLALLLMLGLGRFIVFLITQNEPIFAINSQSLYENWSRAILYGGFWDINQYYGEKLLQFIDSQINVNWARIYITFAYFCLGMIIGRSGILEDIQGKIRTVKTVFLVSLVASVILHAIHFPVLGHTYGVFLQDYSTLESLLKFTLFDSLAFFMSILYGSGFILLYHRYQNAAPFKYLCAYGRTGLTTYIMQSVIGTFLFYHWGLGLITSLPLTYYLPIFAAILIVQMLFSYYWLKQFHYGPLEWLWRSLTYAKWIPNRKRIALI